MLAAAGFAAVFVMRVLTGASYEPLTSLFVLPTALVAYRFGVRAGVVAALIGVTLTWASRTLGGIEVTPLTLAITAAGFVPLGYLLGRSTERGRAALDRLETLAAVAESSHDAVYSSLLDGTVVSWNPSAQRLFGWTADEILGESIAQIAAPGEEWRPFELMRSIAADGRPRTLEVTRLAKDGRVLELELTASPMLGPDGSVEGHSAIARDIGERKAMQAALAESERRLEEAQSIAHLGSWDWNLATGDLAWSRELWRIFRRSPRDGPATFDHFLESVHPGDRERVVAIVEAALAGGGHFGFTARLVSPGAEPRTIEALGEARRDENGRVVRLLGTVQDVTDRAEAESQLRHAEEKLRLLVGRIPAVTYTAERGVDGRWLWVSPQVEQMLGYAPEEWVANPRLWFERIHPEDRQAALATERAAASDGGGLASEYRMLHRSGRVVWVRDEGTLVPGEHDGPPLVEGVLSDVTERKLAEEALRASERRYRTIVETTREGVWLMDPDGRTTFVNGRMAEMLGETVSSMLGRSIARYLSPETRDYLNENLERARDESGLHGELELRRRDGGSVWVQASTSPIVDEGEYRGQLALVTDVSERRSADDERRQLVARLHQHERMESVGQLAGGIAHDFNNLLAVILTYANFATAELEGHPVKEDIEEIARAAERAAALTRQLLVFSRREVVQPEICDLNEVVAETESMLKRTLGEHLLLEVRCQGDLWPVRADRGQLEQVLLNLAINARDAMQRGGRLTIETSNVELDEAFSEARGNAKPGSYVRLAVTDTGEGMSPEVMEHVYEPFFTTKPKGQGTGLGLATVYGIVQQAGGSIDIYSEQGLGTVFKVYFPVAPDAGERRAESRSSDGDLEGNGEKVLMVEDEDAVRRVVKRVLDKAGYAVVEVADPTDGLALFQEVGGQVDLLLTDVVMPGMSGTELVERMRATHPDLKVLLSSGYTDDVVMRDRVAEDRLAFIEKPFSPERLLRKVREVLDAPVGARD
jgi:PAS domain S-box-containing protein